MISTIVIYSYKLSSLLSSARNTLRLLVLGLSTFSCVGGERIASFSLTFVLREFLSQKKKKNQQDREINV